MTANGETIEVEDQEYFTFREDGTGEFRYVFDDSFVVEFTWTLEDDTILLYINDLNTF